MKTLLVTLDNLGDTILSLPVYNALRARADTRVSLWTKDYTAGLAPLIEGAPEIFHCDPFWDTSPGRPKGAFSAFVPVINSIRAAGFDSAVILRANWRKNLSCAVCGIPERWAAAGAFRTRALPPQPPGTHILDSYRAALKSITGSDPGELSCSLSAPEAGTPRPYAAIHPFSGGPARNLSFKTWLAIIAGVRANGLDVTVIASPAEKAAFPPANGLSFSCDSGEELPALAGLIAGAALFIGHDSGPLHMAAALGTPSVGIIRSAKIPVIGPRGTGPLQLAVFQGSPDELTAGDVLDAAHKLPSR